MESEMSAGRQSREPRRYVIADLADELLPAVTGTPGTGRPDLPRLGYGPNNSMFIPTSRKAMLLFNFSAFTIPIKSNSLVLPHLLTPCIESYHI